MAATVSRAKANMATSKATDRTAVVTAAIKVMGIRGLTEDSRAMASNPDSSTVRAAARATATNKTKEVRPPGVCARRTG